MKNHEAIDRRSLEMARRIVAKIDADPRREGLEHAKRVCARWLARGNVPAREWQLILQRTWPEIRSILLGDSEESRRLRQNDPFCERALLRGDVDVDDAEAFGVAEAPSRLSV